MCGCGGSEYVDETRLMPGGDLESAEKVPTDVSRVDAASNSFRKLSASVGGAGPRKTQTCMRPCAPDALPVIGAVPGYEGAFINCAHNCWGILWAPVSGLAMSQLLVDGKSSVVDLRPFDPARFMAPKAKGTRGRKRGEAPVGAAEPAEDGWTTVSKKERKAERAPRVRALLPPSADTQRIDAIAQDTRG